MRKGKDRTRLASSRSVGLRLVRSTGMRQLIRTVSCLASALLIAGCGGKLRVASPTNAPLPVAGVPNPIDESRMVTLQGNVHPLARPEFDQGVVNPDTRLDACCCCSSPRRRSKQALDELVEEQQNPHSPLYHQWLTPAEFGARFGVDDPELDAGDGVARGARIHGGRDSRRPTDWWCFPELPARSSTPFTRSCTVYRVDGAAHIANAADPQIPAALAGVVAGVVSLHDFRRRSQIGTLTELAAQPQYTAGSTHYLFPADFATIYDLNPLYTAGTNGTGSSIAIAARSNIKLSDVAAFRSMAGLPANDPAVILAGADPGLVANDQGESTLDVEWSGAVAPAAAIDLVVAASTRDNGRRGSGSRIHRESRNRAGGERELWQLRAGDGRGGAGLLQQPVGAGGEPGNERLCGLGRCGRGRLLGRHGHGRDRPPPSMDCAVRPIPPAWVERSSTRERMPRSIGPRRTRQVTARRSATFPRKYGTRAR